MPPTGYTATPVAQIAGKRGLVIVLYGPPGVGKTTAAGEAVACELACPGVVYDVEKGSTSIAHLADKMIVLEPEIKSGTEIQGWTWNDIRRATRWYRDTPKEQITEKLVVWDNGSEISKLALEHVVKDPNQKDGAHEHAEIQHWGRATNEYLVWVRMLREIAGAKDITMIITAWDRRRGGSDDAPDTEANPKIAKDLLAYNTRLAEELPGIVDIVGYFTVRPGGKRQITFDASPFHSAKFRRSKIANSRLIPNTLQFGPDQYPIADMIATIKGGKPWPTSRYGQPAPATNENETKAKAEKKEDTK